MNGIILKIFSNTSIVYSFDDHQEYQSKIKGKFKFSKLTPLVGDHVEFDIIDNNEGYIGKIKERKNELYRPKIANVDQVVIVSALKEPNLSTYIINKYLAFLEVSKIKPILLFTKEDLVSKTDPVWEIIKAYEKIGYWTLTLNNKKDNQVAIKSLEEKLVDQLSIFVGQTGAGKTSTLNNFLDFEERTQEISKALNRGKHTTTNVSLYHLKNNIFLADSPGFSSFEIKLKDYNDLAWSFQIFKKYLNQCQFNDCLHLKEKGCAIKKAVENQEIPEFLYNDYVKMMNELKEKK